MSATRKAILMVALVALVMGITLVGCGSGNKNKSAEAKETTPPPVSQTDMFLAATPGASVIPHVSRSLWEEETRGYSTTVARHRMRVDVELRDFEVTPTVQPRPAVVEERSEPSNVAQRSDTTMLLAARNLEYPEMDATLDPRFLDVKGYLRPKAELLGTTHPETPEEEAPSLVHGREPLEVGWVFHAN